MRKHAVIILVIIGFLVYANALLNGFVWDDEEMIVNNPQIRSFAFLPQLFSGSTFNSGGAGKLAGMYYKPLMMVSFTGIYSIFGLNPFMFHLYQITIHLINTILLYYIFKRFLKHNTLAWFLALIFLVHPLQVESVVYSAGLQEVLFFLFGSLALLVSSPIISAGLLLLSLLSKETGAIMIAIVLSARYFYQRKIFKVSLVFSAVSVLIYAYFRFIVAGIFIGKHGLTAISTMPFIGRLLNIPAMMFYYLSNLFFPLNIAIDQQWAITRITWPDFWFPLIVDTVFVGILAGWGIALWKKKSAWLTTYLFFSFWFVLSFGFHLQLFPLDLTVSDRWFYLPLAGFLGMIGTFLVGGERLPELAKNKIAIALSIVIIAVFSIRSIARTFDWRNGFVLYGHDVAISRDSFDLENNYGVELFRQGKLDEAVVHFNKAVLLSPKWWTSYNNLGAYYQRKGDLAKAEELYKKSIANGNYYLAYENLAFILLEEKKYAEDVVFLEKSFPNLPQNPRIAAALTLAYYLNGQKDKAVASATYLVKLDPSAQNQLLLQKIKAGEAISY